MTKRADIEQGTFEWATAGSPIARASAGPVRPRKSRWPITEQRGAALGDRRAPTFLTPQQVAEHLQLPVTTVVEYCRLRRSISGT